ncbi:hypothetical protein CEUSTIGMA_g12136.t1 [Chlamydomonas eustigma]|uniref:Thiamine pyrophosphate enzyme TPP-binding domain-containing protein n=1 Tax=Chlamydomonas eustigma TaxID=1157962 RepID=A0A250XNP3_9CHLO|nr:hypothetical protein CEUSTIGMA_g12136.t1 [Chlamydomonas eustigma]|eukprot:GAX84714.1 hypothetical protein CEUSTIGMA_g12136.t1 [Chlamydomonas eustigma]
MDGSDAFVSALSAVGVEVCFANPGTTELNLVGALDRQYATSDVSKRIQPILCLHENVCTGAADGYARMSRKPALGLLHLGPGLANGLSNLHNARRANSPILILVGEMVSWLQHADPLLKMDIPSLAATASAATITIQPQPDVAHEHTSTPSGTPLSPRFCMSMCPGVGGRVVTLVLPHDAMWGPADLTLANSAVQAAMAACNPASLNPGFPEASTLDARLGAETFITECAEGIERIMTSGKKAAIYLGGEALASEEALMWAGRISSRTGIQLLCEGAFARVERGLGLPILRRLPYFPQEAEKVLRQFSFLVTVDARLPVANFGYKDGPSHLVTHLGVDEVWEIDGDGFNRLGDPNWAGQALKMLALKVGATPANVSPGLNCRGVFSTAKPTCTPMLDPGNDNLTAKSMCAILAALQPEGAIIVDESLTSGASYWDESHICAPFSHLTLTGGSIGSGPALSVGAAVACPDRLVINLQADGSAMYTLQALWTQARECLNVITIICHNHSYSILKVEGAKQRLPPPGFAMRTLTSLDNPTLDWVSLAQGMGVRAVRVNTCIEFKKALGEALRLCAASQHAHNCGKERTEEGAGPPSTAYIGTSVPKSNASYFPIQMAGQQGPVLIQACLP